LVRIPITETSIAIWVVVAIWIPIITTVAPEWIVAITIITTIKRTPYAISKTYSPAWSKEVIVVAPVIIISVIPIVIISPAVVIYIYSCFCIVLSPSSIAFVILLRNHISVLI
jgi:hypothetical protein